VVAPPPPRLRDANLSVLGVAGDYSRSGCGGGGSCGGGGCGGGGGSGADYVSNPLMLTTMLEARKKSKERLESLGSCDCWC